LGVYDDNIQNIIWPSIIILGGLSRLCGGMCKCCKKDAPAA